MSAYRSARQIRAAIPATSKFEFARYRVAHIQQLGMSTVFIKALLLVAVFFLGLTGGALVGHLYHGWRYGRSRRSEMDETTLQPFTICGAVLGVIGVAAYWQLTGR